MIPRLYKLPHIIRYFNFIILFLSTSLNLIANHDNNLKSKSPFVISKGHSHSISDRGGLYEYRYMKIGRAMCNPIMDDSRSSSPSLASSVSPTPSSPSKPSILPQISEPSLSKPWFAEQSPFQPPSSSLLWRQLINYSFIHIHPYRYRWFQHHYYPHQKSLRRWKRTLNWIGP